MNCQEVNNKLFSFVEKTLSVTDMQQVEEHMHKCKKCEDTYIVLKTALNVIDTEKEISTDPFMHTRIIQKIENRKQNNIAYSLKRVLQPLILGIVLVAGVSFGMGLGHIATKTNSDMLAISSSDIFLFNDFNQEPIENFLLNNEE